MNCCIDCFKDTQIRAIIERLNKFGNCDFCGSKDIHIYDINENRDVSEMLYGILDIYEVTGKSSDKMLKNALHEDWDIFNGNPDQIQFLIATLCSEIYNDNEELFNETVNIPQFSDNDFLNRFGVIRGKSWLEFSESIKHLNRFHSGLFNADSFTSFLSYTVKHYNKGYKMFRARISGKSGFGVNEMGAPPKDKRSSGRINPEGVGVLYLSSDDSTVLNEVRATAFDFVTIGTFEAVKDIKVVDLSGISNTSPFVYTGKLENYAINRKVFKDIAFEIAKPLRRSDSILEYIPTQYITEFIKSQGYDGVEYASTMQTGGFNLAVFDENLFKCVETKVIEIKKLTYDTMHV